MSHLLRAAHPLPRRALRVVLPHIPFPPHTSLPRRLLTTATFSAAQLLSHSSAQTLTRYQRLDTNQLQKLSITLHRAEESHPFGAPVPPGYHLVYFTPWDAEADLGADGTDRGFSPNAPFTRRMWAGGRMEWVRGKELRVGEEVEERTQLVSATAKRGRDGGEMVLVEVRKEFWGGRGLGVVDTRSWIFRPELPIVPEAITTTTTTTSPAAWKIADYGPSTIRDEHPEEAWPTRHLRWSPVALFRFSALTFNAHKIHYNDPWTRAVEGHPGVVVHGPLNLVNILNYWRDAQALVGKGSLYPRGVTYRALAPLYAGQDYVIRADGRVPLGKNGDGDGDGEAEMECQRIVVEREGRVCMWAEITSE